MWPVDGVIGENGGLLIQRTGDERRVVRSFWHEERQSEIAERLLAIGREIERKLPYPTLADDQPFRLTRLAFAQPEQDVDSAAIIAALRDAGADVTLNNLWILGSLGGYDKLAMTRRVMRQIYGTDIETNRDAILYCRDSANDAPIFGFFRHTAGVSMVRR